jgi:hypothetical protein
MGWSGLESSSELERGNTFPLASIRRKSSWSEPSFSSKLVHILLASSDVSARESVRGLLLQGSRCVRPLRLRRYEVVITDLTSHGTFPLPRRRSTTFSVRGPSSSKMLCLDCPIFTG